jgi:hypothetical protein
MVVKMEMGGQVGLASLIKLKTWVVELAKLCEKIMWVT